MAKKKRVPEWFPERKKRKNIFWQNLFYGAAYWVISSPLPEIVFVAALVLSRRQSNLYINYTTRFWLPIILLGAVAALAYWGYRLVFGKGSASHIAALLFGYCVYGYYTLNSTAHSLFPTIFSTPPHFRLWQAMAVVVIAALGCGLATLVLRIITSRYIVLKNLQAYKILFVVILLFFAVEVIHFIKRYYAIR